MRYIYRLTDSGSAGVHVDRVLYTDAILPGLLLKTITTKTQVKVQEAS